MYSYTAKQRTGESARRGAFEPEGRCGRRGRGRDHRRGRGRRGRPYFVSISFISCPAPQLLAREIRPRRRGDVAVGAVRGGRVERPDPLADAVGPVPVVGDSSHDAIVSGCCWP